MGIEDQIIDVPNYWRKASRKIKLDTDYSRLGKEYPVQTLQLLRALSDRSHLPSHLVPRLPHR